MGQLVLEHRGMDPTRTLVDLFETSCRKHADLPAFGVKRGRSFEYCSYAEVSASVDRVRQLLAKLGVGAGDRVAVIADNRREWAELCYAAAGRAAVLVPMYTAQKPSEWEFILRDSGAKVVFVAGARIASKVAACRERLPELVELIDLDASDDAGFSARVAAVSGDLVSSVHPVPEAPAAYIYTSGTTGNPKGVELSHRGIVANAIAIAQLFPIGPGDRSLSFLPWAHALGSTGDLHTLFRIGVTIGVNDDVSNLLSNLTLVRPTVLIAVPRIFNRIHDGVRKQMAARPGWVRTLFERGLAAGRARGQGQALSLLERATLELADRLIFAKIRQKFGGELRFAISGSAALSREVAQFIDALGIEVHEGYGLTECSPVVSVNCPAFRRFGSVGRPLPGVTITIERAENPRGESGEILVSGPSVMLGYHQLPEETRCAIDEQGRLHTGDLGRLDEDGYLLITGRLKEQYKLENGKYVVPSLLEEHLRTSPLIANCLMFGEEKPHNVLLVVPERSVFAERAMTEGWSLSDVATNLEVRKQLRVEVARLSKEFHSYERPRRLAVIAEDFSIDNGLLTPSLKVKRRAVFERYARELAELYESDGSEK